MSSSDSNQKSVEFSPQLCTFAYGQPCDVCKELLSLEENLQVTPEANADSDARRGALRSKMNACHDPIIFKLSPEVVSNIFIKFMEDPDTDSDDDSDDEIEDELEDNIGQYQWLPPSTTSRDVIYSPLQLGAVCRSWRHIIWSTPQLWNKIAVDLDDENLRATSVELFLACLGRAAALPLHIILWNDTPEFIRTAELLEREPVKALIDAILRQMSRVVNLQLYMPPRTVLKHLDFPPSARPSLERLDLSMPSDVYFRKFSPNVIWDRLTCVLLTGFRLHNVDIEWNNVTHVRLHDCYGRSGYFDILSWAPRLQHLELSDMHGYRVELPFDTIVEHKSLQYLELSSNNPYHIADFLEHTKFPFLKDMKLDCDFEWNLGVGVDRIIKQRFARSLTRLQSISLQEIFDESEGLIELLEAIPSLKYLELNVQEAEDADWGSLDTLWEHLVQQEKFIPDLRDLYIRGAPMINWALLLAVFSTQTPPLVSSSLLDGDLSLDVLPIINTKHTRPLTSLRITHKNWKHSVPSQLDREQVVQLVRLLEHGISITVGAGPSPGKVLQSWMESHHLSNNSQPMD